MRNHEVTTVQKLLREDGSLREPGWSKSLVQQYDRHAIKASKLRIKEWDYYLVLSPSSNFGVAFTISDDGYIGLQSATLLDFSKPWEHTETILNAFPKGKLHLPYSSESGNTVYQDKRLDMRFTVSKGQRHLSCNYKNFCDGKTFTADITLEQPEMDTMVIATPWKEKKTAFYYNQKINCMRASGKVCFDGREYVFDPATDFGTLDWGRGVWTYDNTWYWGSGNCDLNGKPFGFNIGYGFGDTSKATENMLFYGGKATKLGQVSFAVPVMSGREDYLVPWQVQDGEGRLNLRFEPILDRAARMNALVFASDQHQVFGRFTGTALLEDGSSLQINQLIGFLEKVSNRW